MRKTITINNSKITFVLNSMSNRNNYKTTSQVKYWRLYVVDSHLKCYVGPTPAPMTYKEVKEYVKQMPAACKYIAYPRKTAHRKPRFDIQLNYPSWIVDVVDQENGVVAAEFDVKSLTYKFFDPEYKESISCIGRLLYRRDKDTRQKCLSPEVKSMVDNCLSRHPEG